MIKWFIKWKFQKFECFLIIYKHEGYIIFYFSHIWRCQLDTKDMEPLAASWHWIHTGSLVSRSVSITQPGFASHSAVSSPSSSDLLLAVSSNVAWRIASFNCCSVVFLALRIRLFVAAFLCPLDFLWWLSNAALAKAFLQLPSVHTKEASFDYPSGVFWRRWNKEWWCCFFCFTSEGVGTTMVAFTLEKNCYCYCYCYWRLREFNVLRTLIWKDFDVYHSVPFVPCHKKIWDFKIRTGL